MNEADDIVSMTATKMTRMEKLLSRYTAKTIKVESTQHVANFLLDMSSNINDALSSLDYAEALSCQVISNMVKREERH